MKKVDMRVKKQFSRSKLSYSGLLHFLHIKWLCFSINFLTEIININNCI